MTNATETLETDVEEKEMPKGLKIFLLALGFLISVVTIYFTIDLGSVGEFLDTHTVKHALLIVSLTALVIFGFNLYRSIFGHDEHAKKHAEEILLSGIHFNYPALVLLPDKYLKGIKIDSEEAKTFHNYYIYGLVMISILVMTAIVPICTLMANGVQSMSIDGYDENGEPYNNMASALYGLAYLLRWGVVIFWAASFALGMKKVRSGHKALLMVNGKILLQKLHGSGVVLTFPFLFKSIELLETEAEFMVEDKLDPDRDPKILTGSAQSSMYEVGFADRLRPASDAVGERLRFWKDIFHTNRRFIKYLDMSAKFSISDQVAFLEKKTSMEDVRKDLQILMRGACIKTLGKKTYAQITGSMETVESRIKEILKKELKTYGDYINIDNVIINKIDFDRAIEQVDIIETPLKPVSRRVAA